MYFYVYVLVLDDDSLDYCDDIEDDQSSLGSLQGAVIPIIEGNMTEEDFEDYEGLESGEGTGLEETTDSSTSSLGSGPRQKIQKKRSVCHLQLMKPAHIDISPAAVKAHKIPDIVTTTDSTTTCSTMEEYNEPNTAAATTGIPESNKRSNTDYWRPKLLNKTHKIKIEVYIY